jgi:hypothetical protein
MGDDLNITLDQSIRLNAMQLAVNLTLKDEALFAGSTISFADRIYKFIKDGTVTTTPIKE